MTLDACYEPRRCDGGCLAPLFTSLNPPPVPRISLVTDILYHPRTNTLPPNPCQLLLYLLEMQLSY